MKFNGVCIITDDVNKLGNFYQEVLQAACDREEDFIAFSTEGAHLSIFSSREMERMAPGSMGGGGGSSCTLEFEVGDVDREHARLVEMGIPIVKPPTTQPWGIRSVWFRDPDGNLVNFYARVGKSEP